MKPPILLLIATISVLTTDLLYGQTISTGALSRDSFCLRDSVVVPFTATGTFAPGNAFVLQLSDPLGSFASGFRNIGTVYGTTSGEIRGTLADIFYEGAGYRFRVISTNPQVDGSDNGSDISIFTPPHGWFDTKEYAVTGIPVRLMNISMQKASSYTWDFGNGASPASAADTLPEFFFTTPGHKVITLSMMGAGGCVVETKTGTNVVPNNPTIPANVQIITSETTVQYMWGNEQATFWVCPGARLKLETKGQFPDNIMVFTEVGSNVEIDNSTQLYTVYVKPGASVKTSERGLLVAAAGSSVPLPTFFTQIDVPSITYDYSNVPAGGCPSLAPYTVNISPISSEISKPEQRSANSQSFWLHDGADLQATGNGNLFYLEQGTELSITGDSSTVYLKDGASLSVTGKATRIFYEMGSTIISEGTNAILLPSSGITFINSTSSVEQNSATTAKRSLQLTPNPATTELRIESNGEAFDYLEMVDATGRRVLELQGVRSDERIDVSALPRGTYFVRAVAASSEVIRRVVLK